MANCTFLFCGVLITVILIASVDSQSASHRVCYDSTGDGWLLKYTSETVKLQDCTVYVGSLLFANLRLYKEISKKKVTFPKLQEITGALVLSFLGGSKPIKSPSEMFPNLRVIRGNQFFYGSALVFYYDRSLEDLAFPSLTKITRGNVRLQDSLNMCYHNTIKWSSLMGSSYTPSRVAIKQLATNCKTCNSTCNGYCWNENYCQIICDECGNPGCDEGGNCCPSECLGGCYGPPNERLCYACNSNYYNHKGKCISQCDSNTYELEGHCLDQCIGLTYQYGSSCVRKCPLGWVEKDKPFRVCEKCDACQRVCEVVDIEGEPLTISAAGFLLQKFKGCTILKGNLDIRIPEGSGDIVRELESALGAVQEITGYLQIVTTPSIVSLKFLRNLKIIRGESLIANNDGKGYAMSILYNANLENLWDDHVKIQIKRGKLFFHSNSRLCYDKIMDFAKSVGQENISSTDVSPQTNGDQVQCKMIAINITTFKPIVNYNNRRISLSIKWEKIYGPSIGGINSLVYHEVYYRETPTENITVYDGADACGSQIWRLIVVPRTQNEVLIENLKAATKYAVYVKILTIGKIGASSAIQYYDAPDLQPSRVRQVEYVGAESSLQIFWKKPIEPNGKNITYVVLYQQTIEEDVLPEDNEICVENRVVTDIIHNLPVSQTRTPTVPVNNSLSCLVTTNTIPTVAPLGIVDIHKEDQNFYEYVSERFFQHRPPAPTTVSTANVTTAPPTTSSPTTQPTTLPTTQPTTLPTTVATTQATTSFVSSKPTTKSSTPGKPTTPKATPPPIIHHHIRDTFIILRNLTSFTKYKITIIPCNSKCPRASADSAFELYGIRTLPNRIRDNVASVSVDKSDAAYGYIVQWTAPVDPNGGHVLAYEIRYTRYRDKQQYKQNAAVGEKQYKCHPATANVSYAYLIELSQSGFYIFDVMATTFAGKGNWIGNVKVNVAEIRNDAVTIGISVSAAFIVIAIACVGTWYYLRRRYKKEHQKFVESINPDYLNAADVYIPDEWEFERDKIELLNELGKGAFGMVYLGEATEIIYEVPKTKVAVKTVSENADFKTRQEFLNEACIMKQFDCNHIVRLMGIVSKGIPPLVIMELMSTGDLKKYLRSLREDPDSPDYYKRINPKRPADVVMYKMAAEIADGLLYLSDKKFIHRDLAARNCMVNENLTVKIGDFGLTRDVYNCDYYRKGGKGMLPVRWMPPESLRDGIYTTASDIWSFGIVLWEISTLAEQPYPGKSNEEVLQYVLDGKTVDRPPFCSDLMYHLIVNCTQFQAKLRLTCRHIIDLLISHAPDALKEDFYYYSESCQEFAMRNGIRSSAQNLDGDEQVNKWPDGIATDDASLPSHSESTGHKSRSSTGENDNHSWKGDTSSNKYVLMDAMHGGKPQVDNITMSRLHTGKQSQEHSRNISEISKSTPTVVITNNATKEPVLTGYASMRNIHISKV